MGIFGKDQERKSQIFRTWIHLLLPNTRKNSFADVNIGSLLSAIAAHKEGNCRNHRKTETNAQEKTLH